MADVFENRTDLIPSRMRLLELIAQTPMLDWHLLTKRPHLVRKLLPHGYEFPSNVWLGTTVENAEYARKRIPYLLEFETPAVRFVSCEPLLSAVDLRPYLRPNARGLQVDWVIAGGESGHQARPTNPEWAEGLLAQCQAARVPFLFKQWGNWGLLNQVAEVPAKAKTITMASWGGESVVMVKASKKATGRLLLGSEHTDFPVIHRP